jgi:thiol-disulfide isomerase/thioredoxin
MKGRAALLGAVLLLQCRIGPPRPGDQLVDLEFEGVAGPGVKLKDLRGQVVLLNLWASWCPPCIEELPRLEALRLQLAGRQVFLLSATVESIPAEEVVSFARRHGYQGPLYRDRRWRVAHRLGTFKLPETYIVNPDGRLERKIAGLPEPQWDDPRWADYLLELALGVKEGGL